MGIYCDILSSVLENKIASHLGLFYFRSGDSLHKSTWHSSVGWTMKIFLFIINSFSKII